MKPSLAAISLLLFVLSVLLLGAITLFESALTGLSSGTERLISFLLLVLPTGIGALLGGMSLARREGRTLLAIMGMVLNTLFALFHLAIIFFAG